MSEYQASHEMEEAPYVPTRGEFKLDSGYSIRKFVPVKLGSQDTDEESNKFWVLPYDDWTGTTSVVGVTLENRFKTGYVDYDTYPVFAGVGGYAPDIRLAIQGGPIPMLNFTDGDTTENQLVAPHPSGFTNWITGRAILGKVKEHGIPTGEQCMIWLDPEPANTTLPALDSIAEAVDVTITSADNGDILKHNGTAWVDVAHTLANINDVTGTSVAAGNILGYSGATWANLTVLTEALSSPDVGGDDPIFNASNIPLATFTVWDQTNSKMLYPGDPTAAGETYSFAGTGYTIREEDSITGLVVTYLYDASA